MGHQIIFSEIKTDTGDRYQVSLMATEIDFSDTSYLMEGDDIVTEDVLADITTEDGDNVITESSWVLEKQVKADGEGFTLTYDGDEEDRFQPFKGSQLSWSFYVPDVETENTLIDAEQDITEAYYVKVEKWNDTLFDYETVWLGSYEVGNSEFEDSYYPYKYTITATCGLALLSTIPYDEAILNWNTDSETRHQDLLAYFTSALSSLNYVDHEFNSGEKFIRTYLNAYEVNHIQFAQTNDNLSRFQVLKRTFADKLAFVTRNDNPTSASEISSVSADSVKAISTAEVLDSICRLFGLRLFFDFGVGHWTLQEVAAWDIAETGAFQNYDVDGTHISDVTYGDVFHDMGTDSTVLAGGITRFSPAYNLYEVKYQHLSSGLVWPEYTKWNGQLYSTNGLLGYYAQTYGVGRVAYGDGNNTLNASASFGFVFLDGGRWVGIPSSNFTAKFKIHINGDNGTDWYLKNSNGSLQWVNTNTWLEYSDGYPSSPLSDPQKTKYLHLNVTAPPIPTDGNLNLTLDFSGIYYDKVACLSPKFICVEDGEARPESYYTAKNIPASGKQLKFEADTILIGDGPYWFSPSALKVRYQDNDANPFVQTANWLDRSRIVDGAPYDWQPIIGLHCQYALSEYNGNRRMMDATIYGAFSPHLLLQRGNKLFRWTTLQFSATSNQWSFVSNMVGINGSSVFLEVGTLDLERTGALTQAILTDNPNDDSVLSTGRGNSGINSLDGGLLSNAFSNGTDKRGGFTLPDIGTVDEELTPG